MLKNKTSVGRDPEPVEKKYGVRKKVRRRKSSKTPRKSAPASLELAHENKKMSVVTHQFLTIRSGASAITQAAFTSSSCSSSFSSSSASSQSPSSCPSPIKSSVTSSLLSSSGLVELPLDMWAQVASFLTIQEHFVPFGELCKKLTAVGESCLAWPDTLDLEFEKGQSWQASPVVIPDKVWLQFGRLGFVSLNAFASSIEDRHLAHLRHVRFQRATLSWCRHISSMHGLPLLANMPLTHLDLSMCKQLTDQGLEKLRSLTSLTSLDISFCIEVTDVGLGYLTKLPLQSLQLADSKLVTNAGLLSLSRLPLHTLKLSSLSGITNEGLSALAGMPLLRLDLSFCDHITPEALTLVPRSLISLDLEGLTSWTDFSGLAQCGELTSLNLSYNFNCNDEALHHIKWLPLTSLNLECISLSDEGLKCLQGMPLRELNLSRCSKLTVEGLKQLHGFKQLSQLALQYCSNLIRVTHADNGHGGLDDGEGTGPSPNSKEDLKQQQQGSGSGIGCRGLLELIQALPSLKHLTLPSIPEKDRTPFLALVRTKFASMNLRVVCAVRLDPGAVIRLSTHRTAQEVSTQER
eukprot:gb/GEZN01004442.1/.p1 GENE.gb/GEZN01004442.1/~~gb/GEZN01004442.1/.p1  ORF type:complete len:623 (+),score=56.48 gb/GEZN01004442.1/:140-1870(+)